MTEAAIFAALVVGYAAVARRLDAWSVTPALAFVAAGAILGPTGFDALPLSIDAESTKLLAELALAVLLFGDATTIDPRGAEHDAPLTARLLLIGLPLTILIGAVVGALVLAGVSWTEAALLGAILAPTDAALGMAVFTNRAIPARVRRVLNIESGLNDGIATPVVTFLIAAVVSETVSSEGGAIGDALKEMGIGALCGVAAGAVGGLVLLLLIEVEAVGGVVPRDLELAAAWTILLSVVAHGLSAKVLGRRYGAAIGRLGPGLPESEGPEPPARRRFPGRDLADLPTPAAS